MFPSVYDNITKEKILSNKFYYFLRTLPHDSRDLYALRAERHARPAGDTGGRQRVRIHGAEGKPQVPALPALISLWNESSLGMSSCCGQTSQQYRQAVQGTALYSVAAARSSTSFSSGVSGWPPETVSRLSLSCSSVVMPERITATLGSEKRYRNAQEAMESCGRIARSIASAPG